MKPGSEMRARFSFQSVSITPASGISTFTMNPVSCQNSFTTGHSSSGRPFTTSQRWLPCRSTRTLSWGGSTVEVTVRCCCCPERSRLYSE